MNTQPNAFDQFIDNHPRECLQLVMIVASLIWFTPVGLLAVILYVILSRLYPMQWWLLLGAGGLLASSIFAIDSYQLIGHLSLSRYLLDGFNVNSIIWKSVASGNQSYALHYFYQYGLGYLIGIPLLLAGMLRVAELIQDSPHKKMITALQKGKHLNVREELNDRKIEVSLRKLDDSKHDGTVLGVSKYTGKPVVLPDYFINQVLLVLGTTGSGKTITLRRFYKRAITKGMPLIIVDGKPTTENVEWVRSLAQKHQRKFYGFNCGNYANYDVLSNGGYTELKDKVISLKDEWENDYYKSIAEDYLQAVFQVLIKTNQQYDLKKVVDCLCYENLSEIVREIDDLDLKRRVLMLEGYDKKDITGLRAHLNLLVHSELGSYFDDNENAFSLCQAIDENAVVYFALPALRYPSFSKVLGKLVINDLKSVIDRNDYQKRVFMMFDEFSVFAGEQVLNLVNMGRGKGVHAIFGTQGLADLSRVSPEFKSQVLNCANTIICHRLNDQESAETVSAWMGTENKFVGTAQLDPNQQATGLGSIRETKGFIVHPEGIKQELRTGEAYVVSKAGRFGWEKVRVRHI